MKHVLLISLLFNLMSGFSQSLSDLYLLLPDKYALDFSINDRKALLKAYESKREYKKNGEFLYSINTFDVNNGYINISGAFEGQWELCYWNLKDNSKLIAVTKWTCGPVCSSKYLQFFRYSDGKLSEEPIWLILPQRQEIGLISYLKDNVAVGEIRQLYTEPFTIVYKLPKKGKNIKCIYQWRDYFDEKFVKERLQGDVLELKWTGEKFEFGNAYFEK